MKIVNGFWILDLQNYSSVGSSKIESGHRASKYLVSEEEKRSSHKVEINFPISSPILVSCFHFKTQKIFLGVLKIIIFLFYHFLFLSIIVFNLYLKFLGSHLRHILTNFLFFRAAVLWSCSRTLLNCFRSYSCCYFKHLKSLLTARQVSSILS